MPTKTWTVPLEDIRAALCPDAQDYVDRQIADGEPADQIEAYLSGYFETGDSYFPPFVVREHEGRLLAIFDTEAIFDRVPNDRFRYLEYFGIRPQETVWYT